MFEYAKAYYFVCVSHVAIYQINELAKCIYILRVLSHFQDWKNIVNKDYLQQNELIAEDPSLQIVKMNPSMYVDVYRNSLDEDNRRFVPSEVFGSLEEAADAVNRIIRDYENEEGPFVYAIIRKKDAANIGYVQLIKQEDGWEVGYHVAKMFTGNGYATAAVNLLLDHLKDNSEINEVYCIALAKNKASRKVLDKCGFIVVFEGDGSYQGHRRKIIKAIKTI